MRFTLNLSSLNLGTHYIELNNNIVLKQVIVYPKIVNYKKILENY